MITFARTVARSLSSAHSHRARRGKDSPPEMRQQERGAGGGPVPCSDLQEELKFISGRRRDKVLRFRALSLITPMGRAEVPYLRSRAGRGIRVRSDTGEARMKRSSVSHSSAFAIPVWHLFMRCDINRQPNHAVTCVLLLISALVLGSRCSAQDSLPFQLSNPKHQTWSPEEASRIYLSACKLVARAIRPENPPQLHPKFVLVLGAQANETVRNEPSQRCICETGIRRTSRKRSSSWQRARFCRANRCNT